MCSNACSNLKLRQRFSWHVCSWNDTIKNVMCGQTGNGHSLQSPVLEEHLQRRPSPFVLASVQLGRASALHPPGCNLTTRASHNTSYTVLMTLTLSEFPILSRDSQPWSGAWSPPFSEQCGHLADRTVAVAGGNLCGQ